MFKKIGRVTRLLNSANELRHGRLAENQIATHPTLKRGVGRSSVSRISEIFKSSLPRFP